MVSLGIEEEGFFVEFKIQVTIILVVVLLLDGHPLVSGRIMNFC